MSVTFFYLAIQNMHCAAFQTISSSPCCRRIAPTLLLDVPLDSAIMKEEIFGPLLPIITVRENEKNVMLLDHQTFRHLFLLTLLD